MDEPVSFLATFPLIQSAIKVAGDGGARVQLDIPESELPAIARLLMLRGVVLRVIVEPEQVQESSTHGGTKTRQRAARRPTDLAGS